MFQNAPTIPLSLVIIAAFAGCAEGADLGEDDRTPPEHGPGVDPEGDPTSDPDPPPNLDEDDLGRRVEALFAEKCAGCHGVGNAGGLNNITDLPSLISRGKVIPGQPDASPIYLRLISTSNPMPPPSSGLTVSDEEIALVREWIEKGALSPPAAGSCTDNAHLTPDAQVKKMGADLLEIDAADKPFIRYLTLTHLYNVGYCPEQLDRVIHAANKLVNSLSTEPFIMPLVVVDPDQKTVLRLDLRDYGWEPDPESGDVIDIWEATVAQNPFAIEFQGEFINDLKQDTTTLVPFQPFDAFLQVTTRGDLYYQILGIPETIEELEERLGVPDPDDAEDPAFTIGDVIRAGFENSGVSDWNRIIERRRVPASGSLAYWRSYDFLENTGFADIFAHPIDFEADGGEIIFNLPNGLQAYMLIDAIGDRITEAPTQVVKDPKQRDSIVKNAISCMSCHEAGIIPKQDDLRPFYQDNKDLFQDQAERKLIEALYRPSNELDLLQAKDSAFFQGALNELGIPLTDGEPIVTRALAFEANVDLPRAAAELGVTTQRLEQNLAKLAPSLQKLRIGGISRELFQSEFRGAVCTLFPGDDIIPVCTPTPQ
ncbi:MAG: cytochrome c [Nannocystis sp.]|nr:cytochrome c [Nannocystis sp.]